MMRRTLRLSHSRVGSVLLGLFLRIAPSADSAAVCTPTLQWVWDGNTRSPAYPSACSTPIVVQFTDDNFDGKIDGSDTPDVIFIHHLGDQGIVTVLDGATGSTKFSFSTLVKNVALAAADIDGDGVVDVLAVNAARDRLLAFDHTGLLKWTSDPAPVIPLQETIGIADLDQDGVPEIFVGATVFRANGSLFWHGTAGQGGGRNVSHAVDLDPDSPGLELLAGNTLYAVDGSILWRNPRTGDGYTAAADFSGDGSPEIALAYGVFRPKVQMLDRIGNEIGSWYTLSGDFVSPLVLADLTGDGIPEVVAVDRVAMQALQWTGAAFSLLWSQPVSDSSGLGSATAFDFDGDGIAEIVYRDEQAWYIIDGQTGARQQTLPSTSTTWIEKPIVADIDGDCISEILVPGCDCGIPPCGSLRGQNQLAAYKCVSANPARPLWNEYQSHGTNILADGTVPRFERPPWKVNNSWLAQIANDSGPVADAGPPPIVCQGRSVTLDASASTPCDAAGLNYRWLDGSTLVCPRSGSPICAVTPATTTSYTLEITCLGNPSACITAASTTLTVTVKPDPIPPYQGNVLRAVRRGLDVELDYVGAPATLWRLYRDIDPTVLGTTPLAPDAAVTTFVDPGAVAFPPTVYFYQLKGLSPCSFTPGP